MCKLSDRTGRLSQWDQAQQMIYQIHSPWKISFLAPLTFAPIWVVWRGKQQDDFPGFFFHLSGVFLLFFSKVNPFFTKYLSFLCLILWPHFDEANFPVSSWRKLHRYKILESLHLIMSLFFSHMWWMLSPV